MKLLTYLRERAGLKKTQLGRYLDCYPALITHFESGKTKYMKNAHKKMIFAVLQEHHKMNNTMAGMTWRDMDNDIDEDGNIIKSEKEQLIWHLDKALIKMQKDGTQYFRGTKKTLEQLIGYLDGD